MKYEVHSLQSRTLPFIFRDDSMNAGEKDYTHWHENVELLYFYEGRGIVSTDFRRTYTEKGDLFVINSEKLHMVESADPLHPVRYYCFIVDSDFCRENGVPVSEMHFRERIRGDREIDERFAALVGAYAGEQEFKETAVRACALQLLLLLARKYAGQEQPESGGDRAHLENVKEAVKFIKEHYDEKISNKRVAMSAGLSEAYFSRIFRATTGYTVVSYVNLVRCRNAAKLLKSGKYKVNEVALQCGFENMSYFTKTYRKVMGTLPSAELP